MNKGVISKILVIILIILFICTIITSSVAVDTVNIVHGDGRSSSDDTDWWPMFRHDLEHSGYSTSKAPDTNNVLWNYTTGYWVYSSPAVADGKVYIGSADYNVYCLDADTGVYIWNLRLHTARSMLAQQMVSCIVLVAKINHHLHQR
jgi:outer membrane protein assembly factor BamB